MPQFLSATTTSNVNASAESVGNSGKPGLEQHSYSLHSSSKSIHQQQKQQHHHHVDEEEDFRDESSSDGEVRREYARERARDNNGYHLKISPLETVSRTPKENFSDQVGSTSSVECIEIE